MIDIGRPPSSQGLYIRPERGSDPRSDHLIHLFRLKLVQGFYNESAQNTIGECHYCAQNGQPATALRPFQFTLPFRPFPLAFKLGSVKVVRPPGNFLIHLTDEIRVGRQRPHVDQPAFFAAPFITMPS